MPRLDCGRKEGKEKEKGGEAAQSFSCTGVAATRRGERKRKERNAMPTENTGSMKIEKKKGEKEKETAVVLIDCPEKKEKEKGGKIQCCAREPARCARS